MARMGKDVVPEARTDLVGLVVDGFDIRLWLSKADARCTVQSYL